MSIRPEPVEPVPVDTVRLATAAFPEATTYTQM
jgi:hypothetical protein